MIGRGEYPSATYSYRGWWTKRNWHQFALLNDELDELDGVGEAASGVPITHIIDLTDLQNPKHTGTFKSADHKAPDHSLSIEDGVMFQSNYGVGMWVQGVTYIERRPDGFRVKPLAFFGMHLEDDAVGGEVAFVGTCDNFQLPEKFIVANTSECGAHVLRVASGRGRNGGPFCSGGPSAGR